MQKIYYKKYTRKLAICSLFVFASFSVFYFANIVHARTTVSDAPQVLDVVADRTGVAKTDVGSFIGEFIKNALSIVGLMFFILMVYGGFLWLTARGEEEKTKKARDIIIAAVIGLVIIVAAYAITSFFTRGLVGG